MREAKKPDLTAPRFRSTRTHIVVQTFYDKFRRRYPQYKDLPDSKLRKILKGLHQMFQQEAIDNRDGVELPEGLGFIFIGTCPSPTRKNNINYILSVDIGKQVRHRNFESDNFLAKIFYTNFGKYKFQNREVWSFVATKEFKHGVSQAYPENWKKYLQVDNFTRVSRIFRKKSKKMWAIQNPLQVPVDYNEFLID